MKEIVFADGCFWGVQHFFSCVEGVTDTTAGYANGHTPSPTYETVCKGDSGYAEAVRVRYREDRVSLSDLLSYFFHIYEPREAGPLGPDNSTQYRAGLYYIDDEDRPVLEAARREQEKTAGFPLDLELAALRVFVPAEDDHQQYLVKNPGGFCHVPLEAMAWVKRMSAEKVKSTES